MESENELAIKSLNYGKIIKVLGIFIKGVNWSSISITRIYLKNNRKIKRYIYYELILINFKAK